MEENFHWNREKSVAVVSGVAMAIGILHVVYYKNGFFDEWDYWAGTFGLVVGALIEVLIFMWAFGPDNAWAEINRGAQMKVPQIFKFVLTWVTPVFLLILMGWWTVQDAIPTLLMKGKPEHEHLVRWASRALMLAILIFQLWLIRTAWRRRAAEGRPV
jgi:SNF family Na+-dependent transporter